MAQVPVAAPHSAIPSANLCTSANRPARIPTSTYIPLGHALQDHPAHALPSRLTRVVVVETSVSAMFRPVGRSDDLERRLQQFDHVRPRRDNAFN
jgi:hypothetical protein